MADDDMVQKKKEMFEGEPDSAGWQSTLGRWLRRIIVGLLLFVVLVLVAWFALIGPRAAQITQLEGDLAASQAQIATLEANVAHLESLQPQRDALTLLVDANTARFELSRNRPDSASAALLNSSRTLTSLDEGLGEDYDATIDNLTERLALVKEDIADQNRLAALSDLDVFVNILNQLLRSLQ